MDAVGQILAEREQDEKPPWRAGLAGAVLLHASLLAGFVIAARITPAHKFIAPRAVTVRLVALSQIRSPGPTETARTSVQPSRPVIEKAEPTPPPSPRALPLPRQEIKPPPPPEHPENTSSRAKKVEQASRANVAPEPEEPRAGNPAGSTTGSSFGASLSAFDSPDFNYDYYITRMLATIGANWFKPTQQAITPPVVYFKVARDGTISDTRIEKSSGLPFVDRAALRAVLNSSPLAPLPVGYTESSLGVHLKFQ